MSSETECIHARLDALLAISGEAIIAVSAEGKVTLATDAAAELLGEDPFAFRGRPVSAWLPGLALRTGSDPVWFRTIAVRKDGERVRVEACIAPFHAGGRSEHAIRLRRREGAGPGVAQELRRLLDRFAAIVDASHALLAPLDPGAVMEAILNVSERVVDADAYAVWRPEPGTNAWRIVNSDGVSEEFRSTPIFVDRFPASLIPYKVIAVEDAQGDAQLAPRRDAYRREGICSVLSVPLRFRETDVGMIAFYYREPHRFSDFEVRGAGALANLAASALGSAESVEHQRRMRSEAEAAERRAAFIAEAGAILASSLDYETTLASVARLAVPHVADWCVIDVLENHGMLRQLAVAHVDPTKVAWARELSRRYPANPESSRGTYQVVRTGQSQLVAAITDEMLVQAAKDDEHLRILREVGFSSYMCVPLIARQRTLGAISFISAESGRRFGQVDLAFAEDLARRAAMAMDNAALYETAQREKRAAESALAAQRASEARFRRLADAGVIGIVIGDSERIREANDAFLDLVGYTREELGSGLLHWRGMTPPEHRQADLRAIGDLVHGPGACNAFEKEYVRKDGSRVPVLTGAALLSREPFQWISYVVDLTERKRLEQRLQESQKLESIGLLAGGIAHDFNNLLTGIMGNASLALDDMNPDAPARGAIANVVHASQRAADLTRQLLAYSGRGRFVIQPIDLSEMVRDIAALLRATMPKKVALQLDLARDLPAVEADGGQLQQLVMNLVINAGEAIGDAPGTIRLSTGIRHIGAGYVRNPLVREQLEPGDYVQLEVEDNGIGMDEQTRARIFDPFYTTKFTGRGLGLAAAIGIVRSHRGDIQVRTAAGEGSTFEVLLPVSGMKAHQRAAETRLPESKGSGTVLVVDDEEVVLVAACSALERYGYGVLMARDGAEACAVFRQYSRDISVVLLDMTMPVMNGEEALRAMREEEPGLRVIVSSGYSEIEAERRFEAAGGVSAFIQKPYTASQLAEKVRTVLAAAGGTTASAG